MFSDLASGQKGRSPRASQPIDERYGEIEDTGQSCRVCVGKESPNSRNDRPGGIGLDSLFPRTSHFRARLLHHLHQNLSGFCRVAHFSQECNASAPHAVLRFQRT